MEDLTHESIKGMTTHEVIEKFIDHTSFYLAQDIYPEDVAEKEQVKLRKLERLTKQKTFSADEVHFLLLEALDTEHFERKLRELEEGHNARMKAMDLNLPKLLQG